MHVKKAHSRQSEKSQHKHIPLTWLTLAYHFLPNLLIRPSETDDHGHFDAKILVSEHDAIGNHVTESKSAEDVDEDGLHSLVFQDDSEGAFDSLTGRFAASVEKVGAFASQITYGVNGVHRETGTVDCEVWSDPDLALTWYGLPSVPMLPLPLSLDSRRSTSILQH